MQDRNECDCLHGWRWDPWCECWICRECQRQTEEQPAKPWHLFEIGKHLGYPDCCVWSFSVGTDYVDALIHLSGAGVPDDQAKEMLAALGHIPCIRCICNMAAAEGYEAVA